MATAKIPRSTFAVIILWTLALCEVLFVSYIPTRRGCETLRLHEMSLTLTETVLSFTEIKAIVFFLILTDKHDRQCT
jgi:hypothetical protein